MSNSDVQTVNLLVDQGDCFNSLLEFFNEDNTPLNVSAWVFESQIRTLYDSPTILATFTFSQAGYNSNQVLMSLTATQTQSLPILPAASPGKKIINKLSYDLKATIDDGCIYTIQQGAILVNPTVTIV